MAGMPYSTYRPQSHLEFLWERLDQANESRNSTEISFWSKEIEKCKKQELVALEFQRNLKQAVVQVDPATDLSNASLPGLVIQRNGSYYFDSQGSTVQVDPATNLSKERFPDIGEKAGEAVRFLFFAYCGFVALCLVLMVTKKIFALFGFDWAKEAPSEMPKRSSRTYRQEDPPSPTYIYYDYLPEPPQDGRLTEREMAARASNPSAHDKGILNPIDKLYR